MGIRAFIPAAFEGSDHAFFPMAVITTVGFTALTLIYGESRVLNLNGIQGGYGWQLVEDVMKSYSSALKIGLLHDGL